MALDGKFLNARVRFRAVFLDEFGEVLDLQHRREGWRLKQRRAMPHATTVERYAGNIEKRRRSIRTIEKNRFHLRENLWAPDIGSAGDEEFEVVGKDFLGMDDVLGILADLVEKAIGFARVEQLRREGVECNPGGGVGLDHEEFELEVIEKFSALVCVVLGGPGKQDRNRGKGSPIFFHGNPMVVFRRVGICDANERRWKRQFVALMKSNRIVKFLFERRLMPGKDVEEFMADQVVDGFTAIGSKF